MASTGYLEYDAQSQSFTLPPEYVPILSQESGPIFLGGLHQMLLSKTYGNVWISISIVVVAAQREGEA